jgi:hypothetical protein
VGNCSKLPHDIIIRCLMTVVKIVIKSAFINFNINGIHANNEGDEEALNITLIKF